MAHLVVEQQHPDLLLPRNPKAFGFAPTAFHPANALFASHNHNLPVRAVATSHKRRHERDDEDDENEFTGDDDEGRQDRRRRASPSDAMDRSPTPERVRKSLPKRLRTTAAASSTKDKAEVKQEPDQDVGVLLARLPPQSLLPILTSLIQTKPELKHIVLTLIPRPTLETAVQALADASRKLRDAYPYSQGHAQPFASASFGFGGSSLFGMSPAPPPQRAPAIRDEYVLSRLRAPIAEFVATAVSYLSYFSFAQPSQLSSSPQSLGHALNPSETYSFLAALTSHIFSQPSLTVNALCQEIQPRLVQEWEAWLNRVDAHVNKEGGMFPAGLVQSWIDQLDKFAMYTQYPLGVQMKTVRDAWVNRVGWLIGRNAVMSDI